MSCHIDLLFDQNNIAKFQSENVINIADELCRMLFKMISNVIKPKYMDSFFTFGVRYIFHSCYNGRVNVGEKSVVSYRLYNSILGVILPFILVVSFHSYPYRACMTICESISCVAYFFILLPKQNSTRMVGGVQELVDDNV